MDVVRETSRTGRDGLSFVLCGVSARVATAEMSEGEENRGGIAADDICEFVCFTTKLRPPML